LRDDDSGGHARAGCRRAVVLAGEQAVGEGRPRQQAHPERAGHREQLALGVAAGEAVLGLDSSERRPAAQPRQRVGVGDEPGRCVGDADVEDLARAHDVVQRAHDLLDRGPRVPHVQPVDIDVVGAEASQAGVEGLHEVLAMVAAGVGIVGVRAQRVLGAQDELLAASGDELAEPRLARAARVVVGGINRVTFRKRCSPLFRSASASRCLRPGRSVTPPHVGSGQGLSVLTIRSARRSIWAECPRCCFCLDAAVATRRSRSHVSHDRSPAAPDGRRSPRSPSAPSARWTGSAYLGLVSFGRHP
jgi:hypothetical protein